MKTSTKITEVFSLSKNPIRWRQHVNSNTLQQAEKFKYLGVVFTSDGRQNKEIDARIGKANVVLRELHSSVVTQL